MGAWGHGIYSYDKAMNFNGEIIAKAFQSAKCNEELLT